MTYTMYTGDEMSLLLGSDATDADATRFAAYLLSEGWELVENSNGQVEAWRGSAMTDEEKQAALADCFRVHEVSLDNGLSYMAADEAMRAIEARGLWDAIVEVMNDEVREAVCAEAEYSDLEFLRRYLELAPYDIVI